MSRAHVSCKECCCGCAANRIACTHVYIYTHFPAYLASSVQNTPQRITATLINFGHTYFPLFSFDFFFAYPLYVPKQLARISCQALPLSAASCSRELSLPPYQLVRFLSLSAHILMYEASHSGSSKIKTRSCQDCVVREAQYQQSASISLSAEPVQVLYWATVRFFQKTDCSAFRLGRLASVALKQDCAELRLFDKSQHTKHRHRSIRCQRSRTTVSITK